MKNILIFFYDFEINTNSTRSISRLLASAIHELEDDFSITFFTFSLNYADEEIKTSPAGIEIKWQYRLKQKMRNFFSKRKIIKEFHLRKKCAREYVRKSKNNFEVIIVLGLDEVAFLRDAFPNSKIIYWIHGISAIYNKEYLKHVNKIDYLWSPTKTIYKKIVEELHPVPLLAEFQCIPNWAESYFDSPNEKMIVEIQKHHQIPFRSKVFIFCGGENKLKGLFLLRRALKKLAQRDTTDITIIVTGCGVRKNEVYSEKIRLIYAGILEPKALSAYYRIAEFGLFPSLGGYEHAPVTLIEMIKCNVLPIASDVGGVKEMLGEDYLFLADEPHSVDVWVSNIEKIMTLSNEEKCRLLSSLQQRMSDYRRKNFIQLLYEITSRENI